MKVLGIDIETGSSFDSSKDTTIVTEIGAVLWETNGNTPLEMENILINEGKGVHEQASEYTGITKSMIEQHGTTPEVASSKLFGLVQKADRIVAHNGNQFDKPILNHFFKRYGFGEMSGAWENNWIDTQSDVDYPSTMRSRSLIYLAACHGFVNPFAHRAVTDVLTMLQVLSKYDVHTVIDNADSPRVKVLAQVSYEGRQKAKDAGFYWDGDNKQWFREMRKNQLEKFTKDINLILKVIDL